MSVTGDEKKTGGHKNGGKHNELIGDASTGMEIITACIDPPAPPQPGALLQMERARICSVRRCAHALMSSLCFVYMHLQLLSPPLMCVTP